MEIDLKKNKINEAKCSNKINFLIYFLFFKFVFVRIPQCFCSLFLTAGFLSEQMGDRRSSAPNLLLLVCLLLISTASASWFSDVASKVADGFEKLSSWLDTCKWRPDVLMSISQTWSNKLCGQPLATKYTLSAIRAHAESTDAQRTALVLSWHGETGVGKSYIAETLKALNGGFDQWFYGVDGDRGDDVIKKIKCVMYCILPVGLCLWGHPRGKL
jgi:hypothetical protein